MLSMTLTLPLLTTPTIPQEIIHLIIDEVALQSYTSDQSPRQLDTLKACSITSRSFHFHSRQHLFSEIDFKLNNHAPRQASKLLKILGDTQHDGVISAIRSCNVILDDPLAALRAATYRNSFERLGVGLHQMFLRILKKLKLEEGSGQIVKAFGSLSCAERLEHLQIKGQGGLCPWSTKEQGIDDSLRQLCQTNSLKSLDIARILDVPDSLLLDLLLTSHLRELRLASITVSRSPIPDPSTPTAIGLDVNHCVSSSIERLEVTGLRFRRFLDILTPVIHPSSPCLISMPHLHTLILPVPTTSWELDDLWQFLVEVSSSLKSLQLQHFQWALHDVFSTGPIRLSSLTSLHRLTFTTTSFDTAHNFSGKLENIGKFLALNTLPTTITSITLDVYVHRSLKSRHRDTRLFWKDLKSNPGWEAIDSALSSDAFPVLRSAIFNIKLFYYEKGSHVSRSHLERKISVRTVLPRLAELSAVDAHIQLHSVYSCKSFLDRFRVV